MQTDLSFEQVWRVSRLFATTFVHSAWLGLVGLDWPGRTAILGVLVGATEGTYRAVFPVGNKRLIHAIAEVVASATRDSPSTVVTVSSDRSTVSAGTAVINSQAPELHPAPENHPDVTAGQ